MKVVLVLAVVLLFASVAAPTVSAQQADRSVLTLNDAIARAMEHNPALKAATEQVGVALGQVQQADLRLNPEIEWEGEEVTGGRRGFGQSEQTFLLSQDIELGGKRSARRDRARSGVDLAEIDLESRRLDLLSEVSTRFVGIVVAQKRLTLAGENTRLARALQNAAQKKVDAGATPPVESIRAGVAVSTTTLDSLGAHTEWVTAKNALASLWNATDADFDRVSEDLPSLSAPPGFEQVLTFKANVPEMRRWTFAREHATRSLAVARSLATPNLTVSAGTRFIAQEKVGTFVFGLALPFPLFARNQGEIASATSAISAVKWAQSSADIEWQTRLSVLLSNMERAFDAAQRIRDAIIPAATHAFEEIQHGYEQGRFEYLDLLAAEQDLIGVRERLLDTEADYHSSRLALERLIGRSMYELEDTNGQ